MMKPIPMFVVLIGLAALAPQQTESQPFCGDCTQRWITWPMYEHKIPASEDGGEECGDGVGCHPDFQDGSCIVYRHNHFTCGGPEFAGVLESVESEAEALLAALSETPLTIVPTGHGVVVLGCDEVTPVAHVTLSAEEVDRLVDARTAAGRRQRVTATTTPPAAT